VFRSKCVRLDWSVPSKRCSTELTLTLADGKLLAYTSSACLSESIASRISMLSPQRRAASAIPSVRPPQPANKSATRSADLALSYAGRTPRRKAASASQISHFAGDLLADFKRLAASLAFRVQVTLEP